MRELDGNIVTTEEVGNLHREHPNEWFLLEVIEIDEHGKAVKLKIVSHHSDKEILREHLLEAEHPENKRYIFYFSDPDLPCELD